MIIVSRLRRDVVLGLPLFLLCVGCGARQHEPQNIGRQALLSVPAWTELFSRAPNAPRLIDEEQLSADLGEAACSLAKVGVETMRRALAKRQFELPTRLVAGQLFVALRLYFDVPTDYPASQTRHFGGWVGPPVRPGTRDLRWPVVLHARWMTLAWPPHYETGQFRALEEFEFFHKRFPRRKVEDVCADSGKGANVRELTPNRNGSVR